MIQMIMRWDGMGTDVYDRAREAIDWETNRPAGAVFHVCSYDGSALRITDVWESAEAFERFVADRLMPGLAKMGIDQQPTVEVYPAHAVFAPGYVDVHEQRRTA